jgi:hypothetical protein
LKGTAMNLEILPFYSWPLTSVNGEIEAIEMALASNLMLLFLKAIPGCIPTACDHFIYFLQTFCADGAIPIAI